MSDSANNHIVILVCDNIPNQKFWNKEQKDWTSNIDEASIYAIYGDVAKAIWNDIPDEKTIGYPNGSYITSCNIESYKALLKERAAQ